MVGQPQHAWLQHALTLKVRVAVRGKLCAHHKRHLRKRLAIGGRAVRGFTPPAEQHGLRAQGPHQLAQRVALRCGVLWGAMSLDRPAAEALPQLLAQQMALLELP